MAKPSGYRLKQTDSHQAPNSKVRYFIAYDFEKDQFNSYTAENVNQ